MTTSDALVPMIPVANGAAPEIWRDRLEKQLDARRESIDLYDRYYRGDHEQTFSSQKFRTAFGVRFSRFANNWCPLVVDAVEERLTVQGFRFGGDAESDEDAWRIWQANDLDAYSQVAHTEALIAGEVSVLVAPNPDGDPLITIEHANQMIVAHARGNRRVRVAALKKWVDDDGYALATLYRPDGVYKWRSERETVNGNGDTVGKITWVRREVRGETWPVKNPWQVVPVVPMLNRPRLLTGGESELVGVVPLQDAINKLCVDMLVAAEFSAFRQRWVTGMDIPVDPATKQPVEPFQSAIDRLWMAEDPDVKFGEFGEANLATYVVAIEKFVQHIATTTRTPPHYFYLGGNFPSGDAIKSAETGLVAKARRKMRHFEESWETVIRLAFEMLGDTERATALDAETIWKDPESRSESELADALTKLKTLNVPDRALWERYGFTPKEIGRFDAMRAEDDLRAAVFAPLPPAVPPFPAAVTPPV